VKKNQLVRILSVQIAFLRMHLPEITANELKKLKTDESYKEGFLLAVRLMTSELKTLVYRKRK
jgi:hypothetical protein